LLSKGRTVCTKHCLVSTKRIANLFDYSQKFVIPEYTRYGNFSIEKASFFTVTTISCHLASTCKSIIKLIMNLYEKKTKNSKKNRKISNGVKRGLVSLVSIAVLLYRNDLIDRARGIIFSSCKHKAALLNSIAYSILRKYSSVFRLLRLLHCQMVFNHNWLTAPYQDNSFAMRDKEEFRMNKNWCVYTPEDVNKIQQLQFLMKSQIGFTTFSPSTLENLNSNFRLVTPEFQGYKKCRDIYLRKRSLKSKRSKALELQRKANKMVLI